MTVAAAGGPQNRSVGSRAARDIVQSRGVRTAARTRARRSDLALPLVGRARAPSRNNCTQKRTRSSSSFASVFLPQIRARTGVPITIDRNATAATYGCLTQMAPVRVRSEEHTSELQSLMRISYVVLCL